MEPCVYVVEFGEPGYPIPCANSRMRAVHDRIGYYPLPCESDTLVEDHIIFPEHNLAHRQKAPVPFPVIYCSTKEVSEPLSVDVEAPRPQDSVLSPDAIHSAKLPAEMPPAEEPPAIRDVSRSPAVLTARALASCSDTHSCVSEGNRSFAPSVVSRTSTSLSQRCVLPLRGKHYAVDCSLPPGCNRDEVAEFCLICKTAFARDPNIEVPAAAEPACSAECTDVMMSSCVSTLAQTTTMISFLLHLAVRVGGHQFLRVFLSPHLDQRHLPHRHRLAPPRSWGGV